MDKKEAKQSIVISASNAHSLQHLYRGAVNVFDSQSWTRITILRGAKFDKEVVLNTIVRAFPCKIIPALYRTEKIDSYFLLQGCSHFIQKLAFAGFKIINFDVTITTNYLSLAEEPFHVGKQLQEAIRKRHNAETRTLDLSNFAQDEHCKDIYCPLIIPHCLKNIIDICKTGRVVNDCLIKTVMMQHNDIRSLDTIEQLTTFCEELDLRNNNITWEGFEKVTVRKGILKSILLDGNPLCLNQPVSELFKRVYAVIPGIKKIDGIDVSNVCFGHLTLKTYVYNGSWSAFTDHFLHHYFGLMESPNRHQLARMYHQKGTFSISACHDPDDTPNWSKLANYRSYSRNLLTLSDFKKVYSTLATGPEEIIDVLKNLPIIQFDPDSFTVDVPFSQENGLVLINVGGLFQELNSGMFYFHRSFVLTPFKKNSGEWKIESDMLTISPATHKQAMNSFATVRRPAPDGMLLRLNPSMKERELLIPALIEVTKLNKEYAIRFLEEGSWNLNSSLQAFIDQLKGNKIPVQAFNI